ncbi:uncharacterized protein LOC135343390 isoform X2 [Halichondria panicea]|uniref:uncharacterized protein LOC135343390 isoform X2 n=1 Tax=Halichondria panicea TaxID=6063 RepID=UPI00312BC4F7
MLTINLSFQTKSSFSLLLTYGYDKLLLDMPRTKLSRRAKKSRVSVYEKGNKSEEEIPPPSPPVPVSSSSPLAVKSTTSVSMETSSPSVHDLTVTYDYSTEDVPPGNGSHPTTERFLALFPFNESPNTHKASTGKTTCLWTDLSPTVSTRSRKTRHSDNSSDLHQLNVIAQKLREALTEHKATAQEGMTFEPSPECNTRLNFSDEEKDDNCEPVEGGSEPCDPKEGYKECEDDWFWSQVALQVDTTTPPGRKTAPPTTTNYRTSDSKTGQNTGKKLLDSRNRLNRQAQKICLNKPSTIKKFPSTRPAIELRRKAKSPSIYQTRSVVTSRPQVQSTPCTDDEWGSTGDNDFIDQLLTQGVGLDTPQLPTQGAGLNPPQLAGPHPCKLTKVAAPKYSQEDIRRKRALAKQKLYTSKLNKR